MAVGGVSACIGIIARGCVIVRSRAYFTHGLSPPLPPTLAPDGFPDKDAAGAAGRTTFADQAVGDAGRMERFHLQFHVVRHPLAAQIPPGASSNAPQPPPFQVSPLVRDVLGGTCAFPAEWPVFHADHDTMYVSEDPRASTAACRSRAACRSGPVLIFLPPARGMYWPLFFPALGEEGVAKRGQRRTRRRSLNSSLLVYRAWFVLLQ